MDDDGALRNAYTKRVPSLNYPALPRHRLISDDAVQASVEISRGPSVNSSSSSSSSSSSIAVIPVGQRAIRGIAKHDDDDRDVELVKRNDTDDVPFAISARGTSSPASASRASPSGGVSAATSAPPGSEEPILCGDRVEARWGVLRGGRRYYPGYVTAVWADGAYGIKYALVFYYRYILNEFC